MLTRQLDVLNDCWIKKRFTAEQRKLYRPQSMRPQRVLRFGFINRRELSRDVKVAVVTALLAGEIATMREVILERGKLNPFHR